MRPGLRLSACWLGQRVRLASGGPEMEVVAHVDDATPSVRCRWSTPTGRSPGATSDAVFKISTLRPATEVAA